MAAASLTVSVDGIELRVYGGNRRDVITEYDMYKKMKYEEFLKYHPQCTKEQFKRVELTLKLNKN